MNNERRKALAQARKFLEDMDQARNAALEIIGDAASEERDYFDNMPESFQQTERGERASETADKLDNLKDELETLDIEQFLSDLDEAAE